MKNHDSLIRLSPPLFLLLFLFFVLTPMKFALASESSADFNLPSLFADKPLPNASKFAELIHLKSALEKPVVLVFLSAKCPCSNSHIEEIKKLSSEFKNFSFIGIHSNSDEDQKMTEAYFLNLGLPFPVIQDKGSALADQFKAFKTPHSFVLSKKGEVLYSGGVSNSHDFYKAKDLYLRQALTEISNGKEVTKKIGKALGCSIERPHEKSQF